MIGSLTVTTTAVFQFTVIDDYNAFLSQFQADAAQGMSVTYDEANLKITVVENQTRGPG